MPEKPKKAIPRPPRSKGEAARSHSLESRRVALLAAQAGLEKKATGVEIIGEIDDIVELGVDDTILHDIVQLYR